MKKSQKKVLAVGAGMAALAAAAAGVYMLTGKNAKNRKKVAAWASKMQKQVVDQLKKTQKATQKSYHDVIDTVAKQYKGLKNVSAAELAMVTSDLKDNWQVIQREMNKAAGTVKRIAPKAIKSVKKAVKVTSSAAKKASRKVAKKRR